MLTHLLTTEDYALALTPGFFRFYAHIGVLKALEECDCLHPSAITGSSAGALVGAFLAAGMTPQEMSDAVFAVQRPDIWDVGGIGGLLKGLLFEDILAQHLPVNTFQDTKIPLCITSFDMLRLRTTFMRSTNIGDKKVEEGKQEVKLEGLVTDQVKLSTAARASCTFPGLFQPVTINGTPHIDGGVWDHVGLMGLSHLLVDAAVWSKKDSSKKKLVVNVVFGTANKSVLPPALKDHRLLTIVMENVPMVSPFTMSTTGPLAYRVSCIAMRRALFSAHIQSPEPNHWCCYVDAAGLTGDEPDTPLPLSLPALHPEATSSTPAPMTSTTTEENSSITDAASTAEEIGMSTTFSTFESSQAGTQNSNNAMFFQHGVSLTEDELEVVSSLIDLCPDTSEASPAQDKSVAVMGGSEQSTTPVPLSIQPPTTDITISIPTNTNSTAAANNGIQKVPSYQFINGSYFFIQSVVNTEVHTPHSGKVVADEEQIREMHRLMKLFPSNSVPASVNLDKDGNATYTSTLTRQTSSATITMTKTTSHHHYHHSHHNDATEVVGSKRVLERVTKDVSINDIPIADEEKKKLSENNEDSTSGSDVEEDVVIEVIKRARPNRQEETTTIFETHSVEHHPHSHAQQ